MNRSDLQGLSQLRLAEAKALSRAGFPAGAYYLAGYAVECALKACIARAVQQYDFPDKGKVQQSYTHDLVQLLKTAELEVVLNEDMRRDSTLASNWADVKDWNEETRYTADVGESDARQIIQAVGDPNSGVLEWLTRRW